nr:MAG TPA: hypothetical protein [Caudoviricetes sp.]
MKTPKRFPCPRCHVKGLRSVFAIQMTDPDSPEAYDGYELKFRLVCKRCGFAGYSVPLAKEALLNKSWNEAVLDYAAERYVLPTAQHDWLTVKRPYQHHPTKRAAKTPRASAVRDSGQDPSQLTINDIKPTDIPDIPDITDIPDSVPTYDCYKDSDNVSYNDRDAEVLRKLIERSTYGMHAKT